MNIDQIRNNADQRMKMVLPIPVIKRQRNHLNKEYVDKLVKVISFYPTYKLSESIPVASEYSIKLSELNGVDKQLKMLNEHIRTNIKQVGTSLSSTDAEIHDLKQVLDNLKHYSSFDELDASSKQMLMDYSTVYKDQRTLFWMKTITIGIIIYLLIIKEKKYVYMLYLIIGVGLLYMVIGLYRYFKSSSSMPKSVSSSAAISPPPESSISCSSCGKSTYGCCPDGITNSNSDRSNCNTTTLK
jgi:hypothetical protein